MRKQEVEAALNQVREYQKQHRDADAMTAMESLMTACEVQAPRADESTIYRCLQEPMEEALYGLYFNGNQELSIPDINYADLYLEYRSMLYHMDNWEIYTEQAVDALQRAIFWDPVNAWMVLQYAENFVDRADIDRYLQVTRSAHRLIFRRADLTRYYQQLGKGYAARSRYDVALCCYYRSLQWSDNPRGTIIAQNEIAYIGRHTGTEPVLPDYAAMEQCLAQEDIPMGLDAAVVALAQKCAAECTDIEQQAYWDRVVAGLTEPEPTEA